MATLAPYFGPGTTVNENDNIYGHILFWQKVGSGSFSAFSDYTMTFEGTLTIGFDTNGLQCQVTLTDQNPNATSGPATVVVDFQNTTDGSYSVSDGVLTLNFTIPVDNGANLQAGPASLTFQSGEGGTLINPSFFLFRLWVGPSSTEPFVVAPAEQDTTSA